MKKIMLSLVAILLGSSMIQADSPIGGAFVAEYRGPNQNSSSTKENLLYIPAHTSQIQKMRMLLSWHIKNQNGKVMMKYNGLYGSNKDDTATDWTDVSNAKLGTVRLYCVEDINYVTDHEYVCSVIFDTK